MKFVTYESGNGARVGVLSDGLIFDLAGFGLTDMLAAVADRDAAVSAAHKAIANLKGIAADRLKLLAPIVRPPRIFCIGLNYASHASESQMKVQEVPTVFMKLASSVVGPENDVTLPKNSTQPDYEAELAVVIGKPGYRIRAEDWQAHVFGYTILNDVSARDVQLATSQWTLGKSFPTFAPLGPALVTSDEIPDPHELDITLTLDGEVMQSSNTRDLIFRIPKLIEHISAYTPLEAGDIISTGTPEGVGLGRSPQRWLRPGEEMIVRIEGLGELRNRTRAEDPY
jgi:2-keto-4-pentenoate hydratase/2-oxohepta-3-ene-1,7-dioic acid hydratase in catechol pathway